MSDQELQEEATSVAMALPILRRINAREYVSQLCWDLEHPHAAKREEARKHLREFIIRERDNTCSTNS